MPIHLQNFFNNIPHTTPAAEVAKLGAKAGLTFGKHYVQTVRRKEKRAPSVRQSRAQSPGGAQAQAPSQKVAFILSKPGLPAAEVAKLAAAEGMSISAQYIYVVRSGAKKAAALNGAAAHAKPASTRAAARMSNTPARALRRLAEPADSDEQPPGRSDDELEDKFLLLVTDVGLSRAERILARIRPHAQRAALEP